MRRHHIFIALAIAGAFLSKTSLVSLEQKKLESILPQFEKYAVAEQKRWEVAGMAIGIVHGDEIILSKGYGTRGLTDQRPVDKDTLFQIGSLSKAFTSALVAIAVDREELKWEDRVWDHLPEFRVNDPWVTEQFEVQDLMAQRSGLPQHAGDAQAFLGFTKEEMLEHLHYFKAVSSFRSQYAYQNIFFLLAAEILEKKWEKDYQEQLKTELFGPLGMKSSSVTVEDYLSTENRAEWLYRDAQGKMVRLPDDFPYRDWTYVLAPAGGINSTLSDMCQWLLLQANSGKYKGKQLISEASMRRMQRAMVFAMELGALEMYYALGWVRMEYSPHPIIWHDGATLGVYNVVAYIPEEKLGIAILTNGRNTSLALALMMQFFDLYYGKQDAEWSQKLLAKAQEKKADVKAQDRYPSMPLENYVGTYQSPIYGEATVEKREDTLFVTLGKNRVVLKLKPWDRDIFMTSWEYAQDGDFEVSFLMDESGRVTKMRLQVLAEEGGGDFTKT